MAFTTYDDDPLMAHCDDFADARKAVAQFEPYYGALVDNDEIARFSSELKDRLKSGHTFLNYVLYRKASEQTNDVHGCDPKHDAEAVKFLKAWESTVYPFHVPDRVRLFNSVVRAGMRGNDPHVYGYHIDHHAVALAEDTGAVYASGGLCTIDEAINAHRTLQLPAHLTQKQLPPGIAFCAVSKFNPHTGALQGLLHASELGPRLALTSSRMPI